MEKKLLPERIQPVFPSHPHQTVTGYPVAANTRPRDIRNTDSIKCAWYCFAFIFVVAVCVISQITLLRSVPELPSISIKSMSMTVITNASDTQVIANLEMVFDPVENINKHNSIIYDRVNITAFDVTKGLFSDATFEQRGRDKRAVVVRMENVTVDVSEVEQHIYERYGVSYLNFKIAGFVRIEGGKWVVKHTSSMRAAGCSEESKRVVFPLFQWNQTQRLDFKDNICDVDNICHIDDICDIHGDWKSFKEEIVSTYTAVYIGVVWTFLLIFVVIFFELPRKPIEDHGVINV